MGGHRTHNYLLAPGGRQEADGFQNQRHRMPEPRKYLDTQSRGGRRSRSTPHHLSDGSPTNLCLRPSTCLDWGGVSQNLAFLVAIDRYGNGVPELRTPIADAEALAKVLREAHGFETKVLANELAKLDGLRRLLADLTTRVGSNDRVIFDFAGHGIALPSKDGPRGFFLQDAKRDSSDNYLPMDELDRSLSALPCRHMLVILDCCFAGALRWASYRNFVVPIMSLHKERYEWFIHDAAWEAIASAAHNQEALDVAAAQPLGKREEEEDHSPFAAALLCGLRGAADLAPQGGSADGVITAAELYSYLLGELLPRSDGGFRQTPSFWPMKRHEGGEFVFLTPGRELALPPAPILDADANPWRGLEPYEARHADLFRGRDADRRRPRQPVGAQPCTGGQVHDITQAQALAAEVQPQALLGDKGYDADSFIQNLEVRAIKPVIPPKSNRKVTRDCDFALYAERNLIERFFQFIKQFRGIATRYEKTARNFLAGLHLVCALGLA